MAEKPPLTEAAQLEGLPGGPWTALQVRAGGDAVRRAAGWHIAPRITETVILDHDGAQRVILPSLRVVDVVSVRSLVGDTPTDVTGWRWSRQTGLLAGRFPAGIAALEVVMDHGYELCPADLLPVVASAATQVKLRSRSAGPFSEAYDTSTTTADPLAPAALVAAYALPKRP